MALWNQISSAGRALPRWARWTIALGAAYLVLRPKNASAARGGPYGPGPGQLPPPWLGRSEKCLATLQPEVAELARALVTRAAAVGIALAVTSCRRSLEAQDKLYQQGRTTDGKIVTNAPAGSSWHNYGRAFDVAVLTDEGQPSWPNDDSLWDVIGSIGTGLGLDWGGKFGDRPHFSYHPGLTMAQAKALGQAYA